MQTSSIPMDAGRKTIIALLIINIGFSLIIVPNLAISKQNNEAITGTLSALMANQQRMIANQYLTSSSNKELVSNQKHALTLATQQLNQTNRLLKEIYAGDSKADLLAHHVDKLFTAIATGDSYIQNVVNNHTKSFNLGEKQLQVITPIIVRLGHILNMGNHHLEYNETAIPSGR